MHEDKMKKDKKTLFAFKILTVLLLILGASLIGSMYLNPNKQWIGMVGIFLIFIPTITWMELATK